MLSTKATRNDFNTIVAGLQKNNTPIINSLALEEVNYWRFTVNVDDCAARYLWENPIVTTVSVNTRAHIDDPSDGDALVSRDSHREGLSSNNTEAFQNDAESRLMARAASLPPTSLAQGLTLEFDFRYGTEPFHLGWLTSPWAQKGLTGSTCGCYLKAVDVASTDFPCDSLGLSAVSLQPRSVFESRCKSGMPLCFL